MIRKRVCKTLALPCFLLKHCRQNLMFSIETKNNLDSFNYHFKQEETRMAFYSTIRLIGPWKTPLGQLHRRTRVNSRRWIGKWPHHRRPVLVGEGYVGSLGMDRVAWIPQRFFTLSREHVGYCIFPFLASTTLYPSGLTKLRQRVQAVKKAAAQSPSTMMRLAILFRENWKTKHGH